MNAAKFTPDEHHLTNAPALIVYEIQMFLMSWKSMEISFDALIPWLRVLVCNQRLEVLLLHARNLLEFFEHAATKRTKDNLVCEDMRFPAKPIPNCESLGTRINKRLAHITYTRTSYQDPGKKEWKLDELAPIYCRCSEFLLSDDVNTFVSERADDETRALWDSLKDCVSPSSSPGSIA